MIYSAVHVCVERGGRKTRSDQQNNIFYIAVSAPEDCRSLRERLYDTKHESEKSARRTLIHLSSLSPKANVE